MTGDEAAAALDPGVAAAPRDGTPDAAGSSADGSRLGRVRHDLRTPLNAVIGYSEMLLEDCDAPGAGAAMERLRSIHGAGQQLLATINTLLDSTRTRGVAGEDLTALLHETECELAEPVRQLARACREILADAEMLGGDECLQDLERIHGSSELLVSMVDRLASPEEASEDEGAGESASDTVAPAADPHQEPAEAKQGYVLVADDNELNRDVLTRRLEREGYTVAVAVDGAEALAKARAERFDLLLLDMRMPRLSGLEVLREIKADPALRDVPVVMISASDEVDSIARCIEIGAEDYLPKPFNPVLLRARVGACLEKKRLRDRETDYLRQIEEQRRRSDELLHVILPHQVVEELKATDRVAPRRFENVAVLFCDVVGFTRYCEEHPPEQVVACLQEVVHAFESLALEHDLQKIKTIGDAFMATAGLLTPVKNPVLNSVRCGLEMVSAVRALPVGWNVRVGIHAGPLMAGVVGHRQYLYDIWGDTVNTASRVERHGASGAVNLSGEAFRQVAGQFEGVSLGVFSVKARARLEIYRILPGAAAA